MVVSPSSERVGGEFHLQQQSLCVRSITNKWCEHGTICGNGAHVMSVPVCGCEYGRFCVGKWVSLRLGFESVRVFMFVCVLGVSMWFVSLRQCVSLLLFARWCCLHLFPCV